MKNRGDDDRDRGDTEAPPVVPALPATVPQRIGAYRILRQIGEGGMGIVCEAQQDEPRRRVALKLLKRSIDIENAAARLLVEREVLSMLQHENVARIHDAGIHDAEGVHQPYFVMELIEGLSIVKYCDERGLSIAERLKLLIQVCAGLQHAHSRGVIHRDISANNILVLDGDNGPIAKLIDFGVAKTMWQPQVAHAPVTIAGSLPVTPEYMSPELASGDLQRVGVQSDVFSLGVLLYELITTTLPFGGRRLRDASPAAREHILTHETPPRASHRLAQVLAGTAPGTVRPTWSPRDVRRDLDWITAKALSVDLKVRYASPAALADDLRRFLASRPVSAGPDSWRYRLRKWYRREPRYAAAVSALAAVVVVTTGLLFASHLDLQKQRDEFRGLHVESGREREQLRASRDQVGHLRLENDVLRRDVYSNQVTRAEGLLRRGSIYWAKQELSRTRAELRGWEWLYLQGMVDASLSTLGKNDAGFTAVAHSAALGLVLAGSADGSVWAWDAKTDEFRYSIKRHVAEVVDLAFDEQAGLAVSLGADGTCWRWNAQGERLGPGQETVLCSKQDASRMFSRYQGVPERVGALSNDGRRVCWVGSSPARVIDLRNGTSNDLQLGSGLDFRLEQTEKQGLWAMWIGAEPAIAFAREGSSGDAAPPPGEKAADLSRGGVLFWSEQLQEHVDRRLALIQMSPAARIVMSGPDAGACTREDRVYLFRASAAAPSSPRRADYAMLKEYSETVCALALAADGKTLATCGSEDLRIMLWNGVDGSFLGEQPEYPSTHGRLSGHDSVVRRIRFVGDRLLTCSLDGTARWWDSRAPGWVRRDAKLNPAPGNASASDLVMRVAFSRDSRRTIAAAMNPKDAAVVVTEVASGVSSPPLGDPRWDRVLALGPSNTGEQFEAVVRAGSGDQTEDCIVVVNVPRGSVSSRSLMVRREGDHEDVCWAFGSSGNVLATNVRAGDGWQAAIWRRGDDGAWTQTHVFAEPLPPITDLRFSEDESVLIASGNRPNEAEVLCWDVAARSLRWRQHLSLRRVTRGVLTRDGTALYLGTANQTVFAMDVRNGGEWRALPVLDIAISSLAVSPDGRRLLTGSDSAWARVYAIETARGGGWDLSAKVLVSLPETGSYIPDVAWSPDGNSLAIAGAEDACIRTYRCADPVAANASVLVDGLMQDHVMVTASAAELKRRSAPDIQVALALRDEQQARSTRALAERMLARVADDPDYLDLLARAALEQAESSLRASSVTSPVKKAGASEAKKGDLLEQAQRLAESAIQGRSQWEYRRTLAIALMRQELFDRSLATLKEANADCSESDKVGMRLLTALVEALAATTDGARAAAFDKLKECCNAASAVSSNAAAGGLDDVFDKVLSEAKAWMARHERR